jgi:hypothetical protein
VLHLDGNLIGMFMQKAEQADHLELQGLQEQVDQVVQAEVLERVAYLVQVEHQDLQEQADLPAIDIQLIQPH